MRMLKELGRGFWAGMVLIGLSVVAWFVAPQAHSCADIVAETCDTTWVVVLNVAGLVLFVVGALCITVAGAVMRSRRRQHALMEGQDTR